MKWKALAVLVSVFAAAPVYAETKEDWQIGYAGKDGAWAYREDLLTNANLYIATRLARPQRLGDGGSYSGDVKTYELDCAGKRARVIATAHFEDDGSLIDDDNDTGDWSAFAPGGGNFDIGAVMAGKCVGTLKPGPGAINADRIGLQQFLATMVKGAH